MSNRKCYWRSFFENHLNWSPEVFTYIISCSTFGLLKIGKSSHPECRLSVMQTGCPFVLTIEWLWPDDVEAELHRFFSDKRVTGEWFDIDVNQAIEVAAKLTKDKAFGRLVS